MKSEKIIICGPSGSGKDYLQRQMVARGLKFSPKLTTRPPRSGESDGRDYMFVEDAEFGEMERDGKIKTCQSFSVNESTWHYAITRQGFDEGQVFIMTPAEIGQLTPEERKGCFVVYLAIDEQTRLSRVLGRQDRNDSVTRRFLADRSDFERFADYDMKVTDPEFDPDLIYDLMS